MPLIKPVPYRMLIDVPQPVPTVKVGDVEYVDVAKLPELMCMKCKNFIRSAVPSYLADGCSKCGSNELIDTEYESDKDLRVWVILIAMEEEVVVQLTANKPMSFNVYDVALGDDADDFKLTKLKRPIRGDLDDSGNGNYLYTPEKDMVGVDQMTAVLTSTYQIQIFNINFAIRADISDIADEYS